MLSPVLDSAPDTTTCYSTIPSTDSDEVIITSFTTETAHTTSTLTVTSCHHDGCETHTTKTGVIVVTVTTTDVETVYTTYCPLTKVYPVYGVAKKAHFNKRDVTESVSLVVDTAVTTTDAGSADISSWPASTLVPSVWLSNGTDSVSTYEGAGNSITPRVGAVAGVIAGLLFLL